MQAKWVGCCTRSKKFYRLEFHVCMIVWWKGQLLNIGGNWVCQVNVSFAGVGVPSRAAWGASCLSLCICRWKRASAIQLSTPVMCLMSTWKFPLAATMKLSGLYALVLWSEKDWTATHLSQLCRHNGTKYACQPSACPMSHIAITYFRILSMQSAYCKGLMTILGWTMIRPSRHHSLDCQKHQCTTGIDQIRL